MVMITMYVSWKADIVAAQYDMDSVWNTKQISQKPNVTWTASGTQKNSHHTNIIWKVSGTQNRYQTQCHKDRPSNINRYHSSPM